MESNEPDPGELTRLLRAAADGDESAIERAVQIVYADLERVARSKLGRVDGRPAEDATLEPRALVHETFLRLVQQRTGFRNRKHFFAVATKVMVRAMLDERRAKRALRRGSDRLRVTLHDFPASHGPTEATLHDLCAALEELESLSVRKAEVVKLKVLFGLTAAEIAEQLDSSVRTVERDWRFARAWLTTRLSGD